MNMANRSDRPGPKISDGSATPPAPESLLVDAAQAAALLGVSRNMVWKLNATGRLPIPVRLGRCVRWRRNELVDWINADCPARDRWLWTRE